MIDQSEHLIGSLIGKYKVVDVLANGAMGLVLKAVDETIGRDVAIKLLSPQLTSDQTGKERLVREAQALAHLNHPNIVTTYEFDSLENGRAYLVMEFVRGETLDNYINRTEDFTVEVLVNAAMQIANAIQFAHDKGIIHRDLKPLNVMMKLENGALQIKILDFGIAKLNMEHRRLTRPGEVVGSPIFMSPEQCTGKPLDNRSDIYSFGIILFKCLTGVYPHHGSTMRDTFLMKTTGECPKLKEKKPSLNVPLELEQLIYRCLEREPEKRPASMGDIFIELQSIAQKYQIPTLDRSHAYAQEASFESASQRSSIAAGANSNNSPISDQAPVATRAKQTASRGSLLGGVNIILLLAVLFVLSIAIVGIVYFTFFNKPADTAHEVKTENVRKVIERGQSDEQDPLRRDVVESTQKGKTSLPARQLKKSKEKVSSQTSAVKEQSKPVKTLPTNTTKSSTHSRATHKAKSDFSQRPDSSNPKPAPRAHKGYHPTKNQKHDAWWNYRLKKEN